MAIPNVTLAFFEPLDGSGEAGWVYASCSPATASYRARRRSSLRSAISPSRHLPLLAGGPSAFCVRCRLLGRGCVSVTWISVSTRPTSRSRPNPMPRSDP